jgi:hypothetical protein
MEDFIGNGKIGGKLHKGRLISRMQKGSESFFIGEAVNIDLLPISSLSDFH